MQGSARIKRLIGKALIEGNSCSVVKINNAEYTAFKLALRGLQSKSCSSLYLFLMEQPLIKKYSLIKNFSVALKLAF